MTGATRWRSGAAPRSPRLVSDRGVSIDLPVGRWRSAPDRGERALLGTLRDPVLDVGCGPGRIVGALAAAGRPALGVDPSGTAIAEAHRRRAPALRRSVFDRLPGEGRWATVLLLDGNIGIGGDPVRLLRRVATLLAPGGEVIVDVEPPGQPFRRLTVRVESPAGSVGPWFSWARVSADRFPTIASRAGLRTAALGALTGVRDRWMARAVAGDR